MNAGAATVVLWLGALCARLFRGRADRAHGVGKRVVVVQMAKLGDMVCTTPVFRALKERAPASHLTVIGNTLNKELLAGNPDIDAYVPFTSLGSAYAALKTGAFDTAIIVTPDFTSAALAYMARIPHIVVPRVVGGASPFESVWYRSLRAWAPLTVIAHRMNHYAPQEYLNLLSPLGIESTNTEKRLYYTNDAKMRVAALFGQRRSDRFYIGVSPSAGNKVKNWGAERFAKLAEELCAMYPIHIVLVGGERDAAETAAFRKALSPEVPVLDLSQKLSLEELKAAIAMLDLFVAVDTGPIYIAEAFGIPTVDILGPVAEGEQAPVGAFHVVVPPPPPRTPQLHIMNVHGYDPAEMQRQLDATTVAMVCDASAALLEKIKRS